MAGQKREAGACLTNQCTGGEGFASIQQTYPYCPIDCHEAKRDRNVSVGGEERLLSIRGGHGYKLDSLSTL